MSKSNPTEKDIIISAIADLSLLKLELIESGRPVPARIESHLRELALKLARRDRDARNA